MSEFPSSCKREAKLGGRVGSCQRERERERELKTDKNSDSVCVSESEFVLLWMHSNEATTATADL